MHRKAVRIAICSSSRGGPNLFLGDLGENTCFTLETVSSTNHFTREFNLSARPNIVGMFISDVFPAAGDGRVPLQADTASASLRRRNTLTIGVNERSSEYKARGQHLESRWCVQGRIGNEKCGGSQVKS
uniref:Uncharacterized protein n=1 Tax=Hyaloperonospora arabidopsidis (strain Emoy2) TaxID=559515 RepID=M4BPC0_HYAAE